MGCKKITKLKEELKINSIVISQYSSPPRNGHRSHCMSVYMYLYIYIHIYVYECV